MTQFGRRLERLSRHSRNVEYFLRSLVTKNDDSPSPMSRVSGMERFWTNDDGHDSPSPMSRVSGMEGFCPHDDRHDARSHVTGFAPNPAGKRQFFWDCPGRLQRQRSGRGHRGRLRRDSDNAFRFPRGPRGGGQKSTADRPPQCPSPAAPRRTTLPVNPGALACAGARATGERYSRPRVCFLRPPWVRTEGTTNDRLEICPHPVERTVEICPHPVERTVEICPHRGEDSGEI